MPLVNGVIVAPITVSAGRNDVGEALGISSTDWAVLCTSERINKWSFYKPVSIPNKLTIISENDLFSVDDGFDIPSYEFAPDVFNSVLQGGADWVYNPPAGGMASPYRITDFNHYDHNSEPWFTLAPIGGTTIELGQTIYFSMPRDLSWLISNFKKWSFAFNSNGIPTSGVIDIGMLLRSTSQGNNGGYVYYYKISDWLDINSGGERQLYITFPISESQGIPIDTYYVIPVITTDTNHRPNSFFYATDKELSLGTWYSVPSNPVRITLQTAGTGDISDLDVEFVSWDYRRYGYVFTITSMIIRITNTGNRELVPRITAKMDDDRAGAILHEDIIPVPPGGEYMQLINEKEFPDGKSYESVTGSPELVVVIDVNGSKKTRNFPLFDEV